jgi:guanylate kinase
MSSMAVETPASSRERSARDDGRLLIVSGPSGVGKSTVLRRLMNECPLPLAMSVSATTRLPRAGEKNGVDYHFLSREEFTQKRSNDEFLECQEVFSGGDWYGTLRDEVNAGLARGDWLILEIDVAGARDVLRLYPSAISIFLDPGSLEELEARLRRRNTETEESIQRRLATARHEMQQINLYSHRVINDTLDNAVAKICELLLEYARKRVV